MMRRAGRATAAAFLLAAVGLSVTVGLGSSAALADDENGIGLSVTISPAPTDSTVVPPGSGSSPTGGSGPGSRPNPTTSTTTDTVAPASDATPVPDEGEVDLGGILFVSGVTSTYDWSVNPLDGAAETSITVRNVSQSTFSSTVRFWADGPVGNRLSEVTGVKITALKPGESRTVDARLGGIGQSTFVQVHATVKPPRVVDGVELDSITRDQFVVIPPWGILSLGGLGGLGAFGFAAYALAQFIRRPSVPAGLVGAPA